MASAVHICYTSPELKTRLKQFKLDKGKTLAAIMMKINKAKQAIEVEEEFEDTTIEEIVNELPHQQPRYLALRYPLTHGDGRFSYPLIFIYLSPQDCKPELQMMYAGSKTSLVYDGGFTKTMEFRELEEFTDGAVIERLKKF